MPRPTNVVSFIRSRPSRTGRRGRTLRLTRWDVAERKPKMGKPGYFNDEEEEEEEDEKKQPAEDPPEDDSDEDEES